MVIATIGAISMFLGSAAMILCGILFIFGTLIPNYWSKYWEILTGTIKVPKTIARIFLIGACMFVVGLLLVMLSGAPLDAK